MKTYGQLCGIARALDLLGDRWTLLILRDLLPGPLHYNELLENLEGITTNLLASRLKDLDQKGFVKREHSARSSAYILTEQGRSVEPILFALGLWGMPYLDFKDPELKRNLRWAMVSLKRRLKPLGRNYILNFKTDEGVAYTIWEKQSQIQLTSEKTAYADITIEGPSSAIGSLLFAKTSPWDIKGLRFEGDRDLWRQILAQII